MKLAEALLLRADSQKRIAQLKSRLLTNAKVQEGDAPAETPQQLIAELERVSTELLDLRIRGVDNLPRWSVKCCSANATLSKLKEHKSVLILECCEGGQ